MTKYNSFEEWLEAEYDGPIATTDTIIEYSNGNEEGIVLITRKFPPLGFAIPGGLAEKGLSLEENAIKEAMEETGLEVTIENPGKPWVYSDPNRDPRGHMISHLYIAKGSGTIMGGDDANSAYFFSIDEIVNMLGKNMFAFDHEDIIRDYLKFRGYDK